jgi:bla regulator protein blaR1
MSVWMHNPVVMAMGWTLLHAAWQVLVLGLLAAAAGSWARTPQAKYLIHGVALVACLGVPLLTFLSLLPGTHAASIQVVEAVIRPSAQALVPQSGGGWTPSRLLSPVTPLLPWAALAWVAGVILGMGRMAGAWLWLKRTSSSHLAPLPEAWAARFEELRTRLGIARKVVLRVSRILDSPATHGWWRPVVLVPAGLFAGFPPDLLEALLAHELAHVARNDYLVNLLQSITETLLFFHPVVWWLSRRIRDEREQVCDSLAARAIGDPIRLAQALNALDDVQTLQPSLALPAQGGLLVNRIRNLVSPAPSRVQRSWALAVPLLAVALAATGVCIGQTPKAESQTQIVEADRQRVDQSFKKLGDLVGQYDRLMESRVPFDILPSRLETFLQTSREKPLGDWSLPTKVHVLDLKLTGSGPAPASQMIEALKPLAAEPGQTIFAIQMPTKERPGFLGMAYHARRPIDGEDIVCKVCAIE